MPVAFTHHTHHHQLQRQIDQPQQPSFLQDFPAHANLATPAMTYTAGRGMA